MDEDVASQRIERFVPWKSYRRTLSGGMLFCAEPQLLDGTQLEVAGISLQGPAWLVRHGIYLRSDVPIRSHQEATNLLAMNLSEEPLTYVTPLEEIVLEPLHAMRELQGNFGYYHGWRVHRPTVLALIATVPETKYTYPFSYPQNTYTPQVPRDDCCRAPGKPFRLSSSA